MFTMHEVWIKADLHSYGPIELPLSDIFLALAGTQFQREMTIARESESLAFSAGIFVIACPSKPESDGFSYIS